VDNLDYIQEINKLKKQKDAVILSHYYQRAEIQDLADYVGDSFALSKLSKTLKNKVLVFCGVNFMAESAKILSPDKTVLLPVADAGCPMADMVNAEDIIALRNQYPDAAIVCYVNSTAEVKAECDICCTSSNAVNIVKKLPQKNIVFVPDKNLGKYVASKVPEKNVILFNGYCFVHNNITVENVKAIKALSPEGILAVHPECSEEVVKMADFVGSTAEIIDFVSNSTAKEFIIGTEKGVIHKIQKDNPSKKLHLLSSNLVCNDMKKTTLEDLYNSLLYGRHEIKLNADIIAKAEHCLNAMLTI